MFEEFDRRSEERGTTDRFLPTHFLDQAVGEQGSRFARSALTPRTCSIWAAGYRLPVGNDRERLQRRIREADGDVQSEEPLDSGRRLRRGDELHEVAVALQPDAALGELAIELLERVGNCGLVAAGNLGQTARTNRRFGDEEERFEQSSERQALTSPKAGYPG
ncbi:MAG: hypothetical protein KatS3mg060_0654 [Dehalococcoidia bacterium]|nr:MAG: hypothetical protein KatS3mg060_0654 [Dehalococcoidia bacterium]